MGLNDWIRHKQSCKIQIVAPLCVKKRVKSMLPKFLNGAVAALLARSPNALKMQIALLETPAKNFRVWVKRGNIAR